MTSHDSTPTFTSKVNLVLVPVVVLDKQGKAVGTLRQEDFRLFDKNKPQTISKFSVEKRGSSTIQLQEGASTGTPEKPVADRFVAYVFDDVHLQFGDVARVRDAADKHLATSLLPTDRAAIYTTSGQPMLEFTDDRDKFHETLNRM